MEALARGSLVVNALATFALTGIVWFVQVIHYPLFRQVAPSHFPAYQQQNLRLTALVTGPLMIAEGLTTLALLYVRPAFVPAWAAYAGAALLFVVWLNTGLQVVPRHGDLQRGFLEPLHRELLLTNWIRTVAWTLRSVLLAWLLLLAVS